MKTEFERTIESQVGESVESIRKKPLRRNKKVRVSTEWPFIGRKEPPQLLSHEEVEKILDQAIK